MRSVVMKVILKEHVASLGKAGDTVKVSDGYARNFLIPRGLALEARSRNLKTLEHEKEHIMRKAEKVKKGAEGLAAQLSALTLRSEEHTSELQSPKDLV